jgi:hypothetical protein
LTTLVRSWLNSQPDIKAEKISDRFKKGIPDFLCCVGGIYVALELKADKGTPSPHQKVFLKRVKETGGIAGTCYTLGEVIKLVEEARLKR